MRSLISLLPKRRGHHFQILSDLHLEVGQQYSTYTFSVSAPYLVLAGDIGRLVDYGQYLAFLSKQATRYHQVFLVLGNHEFYGLDHSTALEKAQNLVREPVLGGKVVLLSRREWTHPESDFTILGCTLWSRIPAEDPEAAQVIRSKVSDFKKISDWSVDAHNEQHNADLRWLREQLHSLKQAAPGRRVVVVTHHAPALEGTSRPDQVDNPWSPAFATDIFKQDGDWNLVKTWIFGHTHFSADFEIGNTRLVANQRGYVLPGSTAQAAEGCGKGSPKGHTFNPGFNIKI